MKLYIIGNGFDLAHKLNTKYSDYRKHILNNISKKQNWKIIDEYYPEQYEFWNDAETNVCKIDIKRYLEPRMIFGDYDDLDNLAEAIQESFNSFILNVNDDLKERKPKFILDKNALFLTFNYTETLETLYQVNENNIIHIHNSIKDIAMKEIFGVSDIGCILGHSQELSGFPFYSTGVIGNRKDYGKFILRTAKPSDKIIKTLDLQNKLIKLSLFIKEVVYYGFSFSAADRPYLKLIMMLLSPKAVKHTIYIHCKKDEEERIRHDLIQKLGFCGGNIDDFNIINDEGITII